MIKTDETLTKSGIPADAAAVGEAITESIEDVVYAEEDSSDVEYIPLNADTLGGIPADDYATESFVTNKIAEAQLGGGSGEIDLSGYATKDELNLINNKIPTTAEQVGARPNTWLPSLSDINAAPASHLNDKNNPHGVTPEQIGAHPNTWMPTAADVGARSDTWLPTIAQIGAAPSGYGLGLETGMYLDDCDKAVAFGMYCVNWETAHNPLNAYGSLLVLPHDDRQKCQIITSSHANKIVVRFETNGVWSEWIDWSPSAFAPSGFGLGEQSGKYCTDCNTATNVGFYALSGADCVNYPPLILNAQYGRMRVERRINYVFQEVQFNTMFAVRHSPDGGTSWAPWEYVNPPMEYGKEYRTTKRHKGKPVYALMLPGGTLAGKSTFSISLSDRNIAEFADGRYAYGDAIPAEHDMPGWGIYPDIWCKFHSSAIYGYSNMELSCSDARFYMEYTKTTD